MQRLFSNFANGWPGAGLLLQRTLTASLLVRFGMANLAGTSFLASLVPEVIAGCAAALILIGLWTPIVGAVVAILAIWIAAAHVADVWMSIALATIAGTVAMIGPGAWSIDARLFGRKHIQG